MSNGICRCLITVEFPFYFRWSDLKAIDLDRPLLFTGHHWVKGKMTNKKGDRLFKSVDTNCQILSVMIHLIQLFNTNNSNWLSYYLCVTWMAQSLRFLTFNHKPDTSDIGLCSNNPPQLLKFPEIYSSSGSFTGQFVLSVWAFLRS
jgi:hypothetical protein